MKVLYLSPFGAFGGATRSIVEVMRVMNPGRVGKHAVVARSVAAKGWFPADVTLTEVAGLVQWDNTRFSYYRRLRWLIVMRELANLPETIRVLRTLCEKGPFDVIHCNEITLLPTAILAKYTLKIPLVIHARSLQAEQLTPWRTKWFTWALGRYADAIVAIDQSVARTLDPKLDVDVVYNCMAVPQKVNIVALHDRPLTFGIIGSLAESKGVLEMVQACILLKQRGIAFRLLIAGENVRDLRGLKGTLLKKMNMSRDIASEIRTLIAAHDLDESVEMLGFVSNVGTVYDRLDVLCFPSRLNAPGRPVFEAALKGIPAIVAMREPVEDVIVEGVTGLRITKSDPVQIADAMQKLDRDRPATANMGQAARTRAVTRFDSVISAGRLIEIYERVVHKGEM